MAITVTRAVDFGDGILAVDFSVDGASVQLSGNPPFREPYRTPYEAWIGSGNTPEPPPTSLLLDHARARRIQQEDAKALQERLAKPDEKFDKIAEEIKAGTITTTAQIDAAFE